ncbi:hypothetical protein VaNZ11_001744 [Volvox africanus]|uniref:Mediator of RNA polymerase II transcription subunit 13 n=1 Tax=Volvox africanus TaxID=51714 RepID=A0ABQ5RRQ2_9CHLO|nr:hypothetical protein VaNZ11_001744 [Volvox africanus]
MHRARTRVLVAPEWSSFTAANSVHSPGAETSIRERLSHLVSDGAVTQDGDRAASAADLAMQTESGQPENTLNGANAVAPSPAPEPAAPVLVTHQVLYPPPVPPYAPVRSAWPDAALIDLIKQQALYPTDVNVRFGGKVLRSAPGGMHSSALLRAIAEEAQVSIAAAPASASFQFVQLLGELCGRAAGGAGSCTPPGAGGQQSSYGSGQGWRRPVHSSQEATVPPTHQPAAAALAPAVALAAAASGRGAVPLLEATPLGAPAALVGFEGDWLAVQPAVLPCWDKVSLEPCGPAKAAQYYVVCGEQHSSAARMFMRDVSATFLGMRLGIHTPGRTPAHLHSIDGIIPVPLDPGPGPPLQPDADPLAALSWHPLARRPDPAVVRSAVLGFRSNHAMLSMAGEPAWAPDEACYRPGMTCVSTGRPPAAATVTASPLSGPLCHFWRNLRHVSRQLQRHLLLQPPQQQQQEDSSHAEVAQTATGRVAMYGSGTGLARSGCSSSSSSSSLGPEEPPDVRPPALVVYIVPPSDSEADVMRALMEVCAWLAPVTPAARTPAAPVPQAAPPQAVVGRRGGGDVATFNSMEVRQHHHHQQQQQQQKGQGLMAAPTGVAHGCRGGGDGYSTARAMSVYGQREANCPTSGCSAASTPPELPAVPAMMSGASSFSSGPTCRGGGTAAATAAASMDSTDPALLARLGGAARNLYRAASYPSANAIHGSLSPQLDLSQLAAIDLVVQVVLPSSLHDITGASVRATACAAYSKLCRRRAGYGAAAASAATDAQAPSLPTHTAITASNSATTAAQTPGGRGDSGGGGGDYGGGACLADIHQRVASSCSGRTTLYEPLVAVAPLTLPAVAAADDELAALPLPPPVPPVTLHQCVRPPTDAAKEAAAVDSPHRNETASTTVPQHAPGSGSTAALTPPTLHGCYAWWKCPEASGRTVAVAAGPQSCGVLGHPPYPQRCWLAMTFCDAGGKLLDARALALCVDAHDGASVEPAAAGDGGGGGGGGGSGSLAPDGVSNQAARSSQPQFCNCKPDSSVSGGGGGNVDARHDRNAVVVPRCWKGAAGGSNEASVHFGNGDGSSLLPTDWGQPGPQPQTKRLETAQQTMGATMRTTPAAARTELDALVCRTVLGHARLLSRQLAEAFSGAAVAAGTSGAASTESGATPSGAAGASVTRRQGLRGALMVPLTLTKLGAPTAAEAAEWHALLQPGAGGGGGGNGGERPHASSGALPRRRWDQAAPPAPSTTSAVCSSGTTLAAGDGASAAANLDTAVTLAWLDLHPSVVVQPGCRLPAGGFVISAVPSSEPQPYSVQLPAMPLNPAHAHLHSHHQQQQQHHQQSGGPRAPLTLVAFPAQRPPSTWCAAAEALNRRLRLLSVHPWPMPSPTRQPSGAGAVGAGGGEEGQLSGGSVSLAQADGLAVVPLGLSTKPKRPAGCSTTAHSPSGTDFSDAVHPGTEQHHQASGHPHQHKRRRWGERVDGGGGPVGGGTFVNGSSTTVGFGGCRTAYAQRWSDPSWSMLRDLYGLCLLRDWLLSAQSGSRGGPLPGRCGGGRNGGGNAAGDSDDWDAGMEDGDGADAGSDAPLLLPLHAAVCRQLLRMLVACERLCADM